MDILDLSVGEKKSRRKAQLPQRRQNIVLSRQASDPKPDDQPEPVSESVVLDRNHRLEVEQHSESSFHRLTNKDRSASPEYAGRFTPNTSEDTSSSAPPSVGNGGFAKTEDPTPFGFREENRMLQRPSASDAIGFNNTNNNNNLAAAGFNGPAFSPASLFNKFPVNPSLMKDYCDRLGAENGNLFTPKVKSRPGSMKSDRNADDVQPRDMPGIPERTKKQNRWAFNVWREWARKRNLVSCGSRGEFGEVPLDVGKATETQLDHWLSKFVQEVRRKDGNPYPPHTLMQIVMGIQRYLRQQAGRPSICILDRSNPTYSGFRAVLDIRIKELTNDGVTSGKTGRKTSVLPLSAKALTSSSPRYPEESALWEAGILGLDTALGLLNAVFFHNTVSFGIRTIDDHWNLKVCHFDLGRYGDQNYVEFLPTRDKMFVNRGLSQDKRLYADVGNPRCPVKIYQKYISLVPDDGAFYRHPQEPTLVDRTMRFSDQWIGKNRLRAMIKHIFDTTRLDGITKQHHQINWPVAQPQSMPLNPFASHKASPNPTISTNNFYDRLANAVLHLSRANKTPPVGLQGYADNTSGNVTPGSCSPTISSPRHSESERDMRDEVGSDISLMNSKRKRETDSESVPLESRNKRISLDSDQVELTKPSHVSQQNEVLEISVPRMITSVVIVKGNSRIAVDLD